MAGKPSLKSQNEEVLLEAGCLFSNFTEVIDNVHSLLNKQEELDHKNDDSRNVVMWHLLKALEFFSSGNYENANKHVHAAVQKLHEQENVDFLDDKPRIDVKIQLALYRQKALDNQEILKELIKQNKGPKNRQKALDNQEILKELIK